MCSSFSVGRVLIDTCMFDMINEWVHVTIGTSEFDVLVKEVGREMYGEECFPNTKVEQKNKREVVPKYMQHIKVRNEASSGVEPMVAGWDPEAERTVVESLEQDKGKVGILSCELNEWNFQNSKGHYVRTGCPLINGKEDVTAIMATNMDEDSDCTVSCTYEEIQRGYPICGQKREHSIANRRINKGLLAKRPKEVEHKGGKNKKDKAQLEEYGFGNNKNNVAQLEECGLGQSNLVMDDPVEGDETRLAACALECIVPRGQAGEQDRDGGPTDSAAEEMLTVGGEPSRGQEEHDQFTGDATIGNQFEGFYCKMSNMKPDEVEGRVQAAGDAKS
ncbi:uncharacterized protein DS421_19g654790 [Arachis hypogaea]|uniref:Uncharacterized protein n=1 Tax=Arachis hypogaea TaxID=3818 RepID=A0A6B9V8E9_ARAHY|nr:uncharacterized protein DS421_19g654790 [Arachis hypogaea]